MTLRSHSVGREEEDIEEGESSRSQSFEPKLCHGLVCWLMVLRRCDAYVVLVAIVLQVNSFLLALDRSCLL